MESALQLRLHHISYATSDTDSAIAAFKLLYPNVEVYRALEPTQNVLYSYLRGDAHDHRIELVEPAGTGGPVDKLLNGREIALYHVSYSVPDFWRAVQSFKDNGFFMVSDPFEPQLERGTLVCHFYNLHAGMIELMGPNSARPSARSAPQPT